MTFAAFCALGVILGLWLTVCAAICAWYVFVGHRDDTSGDVGLSILVLPIVPFVLAFHKICELIRRIS